MDGENTTVEEKGGREGEKERGREGERGREIRDASYSESRTGLDADGQSQHLL
jgi:hypothetical protein